MNSFEILSRLKIDLSINSRKIAKNTILASAISAKDLIQFINKTNERNQVLFTCVLDYIIDDFPYFLDKDLNAFISLQKRITNETCKRTSSRIIHNILVFNPNVFNKEQKEAIINIHFDWLISDSFVATRVNCISVLFELRNEAEWIKTELVGIIEQQIILQEPSFVSRARKIIKKLNLHQ